MISPNCARFPIVFGLLLALASRAAVPAGLSVQPLPQTVVAGCDARFFAEVSGTSPLSLQWYRDGQPIPGKVDPILLIRSVRLEDNGARLRLAVTNELGGVVSDEVTLTVILDETAPVIREVAGDASRGRVFVRFGGGACGEPHLDRASAEDVANYTLSNAHGSMLAIHEASLDASGTLVTLITDDQFEDVEYTLAAQGVRDEFGHVMTANTSMNFRAQWPVPATVLIERFRSSGENCAGPCPVFPCGTNLMSRSFVHAFNSELDAAGDPHEAHCVRMSGYFIAPIAGRWIFYLRSAEPAKLYAAPMYDFGVGGIGAGAFFELVPAATCCQPFAANASEPIQLAANQLCYLEGLARESAGPGYLQVAAKLEGDPAPADQLIPIPAEYLRPFPAGHRGVIRVLSSPIDAYSLNGSAATFGVRAEATPLNSYAYLPALYYQWERSDGYFSEEWEDVSGATNAVYTTPMLADCQSHFPARYRCRLFTAGASTYSAPAKLMIIVDHHPPAVDGVSSGPTLDTVTVTYSSLVTRASAGDLFNYSIAGLNLESVEVLSDTKVRLKTERQIPDQVYTLVVNGVFGLGCGQEIFQSPTRFQAWRAIRRSARREVYFRIPGRMTEDLRRHPSFPGTPDRTDLISELDAGTGGVNFDLADDYGMRITGYLQPSVTQAYDFYLSCDETGEFRISADESPDHLQLACAGYGPYDWRDWGDLEDSEAPNVRWSRAIHPNGIVLQAGRQYAFEALLKDSFGADHLSIAWTRAGDPVPVNGASPIDGSVLVTYGRVLDVIRSGDSLRLSWTMGGYLHSAPSPDGPWNPHVEVPLTANSFSVSLAESARFYRVHYPSQ